MWESHPRYTREILRDHDNRFTRGERSCWGGGDPRIYKGKDVNDDVKEINLQSQVDGVDQEIYCIKLPGVTKIVESEPENQNHAVIFTIGEALQAIDMNQDNY
ncbi:hypothetical protein IEQ34_008733 [Dendrobium chrysotoxum]|uniref:Glycosyl transferase 48 domain-containing protein n=1 Tax=Dendrobium chrysotoxum TaxID=161865 RepID=A0AAV7GZQ6_DENCH|nr:hypothetical protein IEQ34_008733 [Dendrobium chrysotoxum]